MKFDLNQHLQDRKYLIRSLREAICGPNPAGKERPLPSHINWSEIPFKQPNGEEVLDDSPIQRYGSGILHPPELECEQEVKENLFDSQEGITKDSSPVDIKSTTYGGEADSDDFDIVAVNKLKQSSMGISCCVDLSKTSTMTVVIPKHTSLLANDTKTVPVNGIYRVEKVYVGDNLLQRDLWCREPFFSKELRINIDLKKLEVEGIFKKLFQSSDTKTSIELKVYSRSSSAKREQNKVITVCLVNQSSSTEIRMEEQCLFQTYFRIEVMSTNDEGGIIPYPNFKSAYDNEEQSIELLYRHRQTFGIGHGCSANWNKKTNDSKTVSYVAAEVMPIFEDKSLTPNISDKNGNSVQIPMIELTNKSGHSLLIQLKELYGEWISNQKSIELELETDELKKTLIRHTDVCFECMKRIDDGIRWLKQDEKAQMAFELANKAMVMQKFLGNGVNKKKIFNAKNNLNDIEENCGYSALSEIPIDDLKSWCWRPFQIAFILMSLKSAVDGTDEYRNNVELIWFPTGGGKTEAYLGLAAFTLFYRRLQNQTDVGTHVLMRYTLRLLTTQQFQRASRLICAMELIRRKKIEHLGPIPFSIGIWVGGENTPNNRLTAKKALRELQRYPNNKNPFVHESCPWCGTSFNNSKRANNRKLLGYAEHGKTVVFSCPNRRCSFHGIGNLPIYVVDEDIYEFRPDIIIGTVDKFAQLIWRPEVRNLFGINNEGKRFASPPGLIIQDELHLISGPLGSMCGLFETIVEELCTDRRGEEKVLPKIICSTATIRKYGDQVKNLFARTNKNGDPKVTLFPPPGSDADDSFFAVADQDESGKNKPGRIYIGINAPGYSSFTFTQVIAYTNLLNAANAVSNDPKRQDPWWTLLTFYNSLRELGTALTLFQTDIPDYRKVLRRQTGDDVRIVKQHGVEELTSRLSNEEIPRVLAKLESAKPDKGVLDACLASSIIEVGIDVGRLCVMSIVGQPKTTSQYIQVSGRVGRNKPGVVFTFYSPNKPRDRSHYERFRSYHEKLYAQVEPTSVTPFAPPVLQRSLHAALTAGIRQLGDEQSIIHPNNVDDSLISRVADLIAKRAQKLLDANDLEHFHYLLARRKRELKTFGKEKWTNYEVSGEDAQLCYAGEFISKIDENIIWPTQTSMRNVDATCQGDITFSYQKRENLEEWER